MNTYYLKTFFLIVGIVLGIGKVNAQSAQDINSQLSQAYKKDQEVRSEFMKLAKLLNSTEADKVVVADSLIKLKERMQVIDKENLSLIASTLKDGLPKGLSSHSYEAIWLIVDHADLEQQKHYLPLMEQAASEGLIDADDYATLTDRIKMKEGKPQKYGTQSYSLTMDGKQIIYIWPVEDPEKLDEFRKEIKTISIKKYVRLLKKTTGCEVIYDSKLTVEQMKEKIGK